MSARNVMLWLLGRPELKKKMLLNSETVHVSLTAKSLQEFATVLRNLEDERMRMVWPWEWGAWGWRAGLIAALQLPSDR